MLSIKSRNGGDFNLLMELLRGEHWQMPSMTFKRHIERKTEVLAKKQINFTEIC